MALTIDNLFEEIPKQLIEEHFLKLSETLNARI